MKIVTKKLAMRSGATAALVSAVLASGCATSFAATPAATPSPSSPASLTWSQGFNMTNDSAETYDFVRVTGKLPAPNTAPLLPGATDNFEIPVKVGTHQHGSAYFNVMAPGGAAQIGTLEVDLNTDGAWNVEYFDMSGNRSLDIIPSNDYANTHFSLLDEPGSAATNQTYTAGSAAEETALQQVCATNVTQCTFTTTSETQGYSSQKLLAEAYNSAGASSPSSLTANNGYSDATTTQWGGSATVGGSIMGIVDAEVSANYSHSVEDTTDFSTSYQIPVPAGETGYIWAQIPQYIDSGTFTVHLGNTTWTMPGVQFINGDTKGVISYSDSFAQGNVPLPIDDGVSAAIALHHQH